MHLRLGFRIIRCAVHPEKGLQLKCISIPFCWTSCGNWNVGRMYSSQANASARLRVFCMVEFFRVFLFSVEISSVLWIFVVRRNCGGFVKNLNFPDFSDVLVRFCVVVTGFIFRACRTNAFIPPTKNQSVCLFLRKYIFRVPLLVHGCFEVWINPIFYSSYLFSFPKA